MIHHSRLVYSERLFYFEGLVLPAGIEFVELGSVSPKGRDFFTIANFLGSFHYCKNTKIRPDRNSRPESRPTMPRVYFGLVV